MTKKKRVVFHLDKLLEDRKLGQRETARLANVRHATLHQIYHNQIQRLPMDVLERLCDVLEVKDINQFMEIIDVDEEDVKEEENSTAD